jgi:hypothetical protein
MFRFDARSLASLIILSEQMDAEELVNLIGLSPDELDQRGADAGAVGRAKRRFSVWRVDSGIEGRTPDDDLRAVLRRVEGITSRIAAAARDPRIHSVSLWVWSDDPDFALAVTPAEIVGIASLGASLKVKVMDLRDQDEAIGVDE